MSKLPIKQDIVIRFRLALVLMWIIAAAIVYKIFFLQQFQKSRWQKAAKKQGLQAQVKEIEATRGNIYAADGSLLATSVPYYEIYFDPSVTLTKKNNKAFKDTIDAVCQLLSRKFGDRSKQEYLELFRNARQDPDRHTIKLFQKSVDFQTRQVMKRWPLLRVGQFKSGFVFNPVEDRYYPFGGMAQRTIGRYQQNSKEAKAGIEESFNKELAGEKGTGLFEPISGGWRPVDEDALVKPVPGQDIYTTLDVNIQDVAESSLAHYLKRYRSNFGCVVVMETATGHIKALSNLTRRGDSTYIEDYNYAVRYRTDPGSTFKLATIMAVMEDANVSLSDPVQTGSGYLRYSTLDIRDDHPIGTTTVQGVIENSSNVGIFQIMRPHFINKPEKFIEYLEKFRLRESLHFQIKGESPPIVKDPTDRTWSKITLPQMSRGYEILLTPLQTLAFYNAIANNGNWIQPLLVKETKIADEVMENCGLSQTKSDQPICSSETVAKLRKMLEGVVERGTAHNIKSLDYGIAGKTGTAQKIIGGRPAPGKYFTSFVGYFPADKPKYSCIVVVDEPKSVGGEVQLMAAAAAAPVFKEIADKIFANDVQMHKLLKKTDSSKANITATLRKTYEPDARLIAHELGLKDTSAKLSTSTDKYRVPDLKGMSLRDALHLLENKGFRVSHRGIGKVAQQSLPPGTSASANRIISLVLQ